MSGVFNKALAAHAAGSLSEAYIFYSAAREEGGHPAALFQNFGALCRRKGELDKAEAVFNEGIAKYPGDPGIIANRVNLWKETKPFSAISDLLVALRKDPGLIESWANLLYLMHEQGCFNWGLDLAREAIRLHPHDPRFPFRALTLILALSGSQPELLEQYEEMLISKVEAMIPSLTGSKKHEIMIAMACYGQTRNNKNLADYYYRELEKDFGQTAPTSEEEAREQTRNYHVSFWNYSSYLIKNQHFAEGWKLFDHGLQAPCEGNTVQKWQREMIKPFSPKAVRLWRGESLTGKRLLVLAEQGIGDTVMFATLLPILEKEGAALTLLTSKRMCRTYTGRCQFPIKTITIDEIHEGKINDQMFDYQVPIGSICQHRFQHPRFFAPQTPILKAKLGSKDYFRKKYEIDANTKLIGISWKGGASESRKREKSIDAEELVALLSKLTNARFVSLQYGKAETMAASLSEHNIPLIIDQDIDAIHGFDSWVDQVGACDGVISVANTTIHASGSLGIPTMCLLGSRNDWRWLSSEDVTVSYWYNSVGIARQTQSGDWGDALNKVRNWVDAGMPLPDGARYLSQG